MMNTQRRGILPLILLLSFSLFGEKRLPTKDEIIGTWDPNTGSHSGIYEFKKDGTGSISSLHDMDFGTWTYSKGLIVYRSTMGEDIDTIPVAIDNTKEGILFIGDSPYYSLQKMDSIHTVEEKKRTVQRTKFEQWKELLWTQTMPMSRLDSYYLSGVWYAQIGWGVGEDLLILDFTSNKGLEVYSYELDFSENPDIMECIPNPVDKPTLYRYELKNNQLLCISAYDSLTLHFKKISAEMFNADVERYGGTSSNIEFFQLPYCP